MEVVVPCIIRYIGAFGSFLSYFICYLTRLWRLAVHFFPNVEGKVYSSQVFSQVAEDRFLWRHLSDITYSFALLNFIILVSNDEFCRIIGKYQLLSETSSRSLFEADILGILKQSLVIKWSFLNDKSVKLAASICILGESYLPKRQQSHYQLDHCRWSSLWPIFSLKFRIEEIS